MDKLKNFIMPNKIVNNNESRNIMEGKLETDAQPVDDDNRLVNGNNSLALPSANTTPSASVELTEAVVRELADPNYNSVQMVHSASIRPGGPHGLVPTQPNNTMNVNSAQQQVVMQISNANQVHFGSVYNFNQNRIAAANRLPSGNSAKTSNDSTKAFKTTQTIVIMKQSKEEPNHRMLETIATHLGEGWKQVMRNLGHSEGQIDQAYADNHIHGVREVIYQLLLKWVRNADDGAATLGYITTLLWDLNHRECVYHMKLVYKARDKR